MAAAVLGDPDAALRAAELADSAWVSGTPLVLATWAQVRLAAGVAHIMKGDLDGAQTEFALVPSLAPEYRLATITGYASQMEQRLSQRRFHNNAVAMEIRQQIHDFNTIAYAALAHGEAS